MLGLDRSGLLDPPLFEVLSEGLVGVNKAVAVGPVGQRYRVGGIAEVIFKDLPVMNALAKLGDPVGRVYDGVLETQKEWAAGNLKLFDEVCDIGSFITCISRSC